MRTLDRAFFLYGTQKTLTKYYRKLVVVLIFLYLSGIRGGL